MLEGLQNSTTASGLVVAQIRPGFSARTTCANWSNLAGINPVLPSRGARSRAPYAAILEPWGGDSIGRHIAEALAGSGFCGKGKDRHGSLGDKLVAPSIGLDAAAKISPWSATRTARTRKDRGRQACQTTSTGQARPGARDARLMAPTDPRSHRGNRPAEPGLAKPSPRLRSSPSDRNISAHILQVSR